MKSKVFALSLALFMASCASVPTVDSLVDDGGQVVEGGIGSLIGDEGVTLAAVDGTWYSYLAPDGRKESFIKPLNARETLSWRFNEDGKFCEMQFRPRTEVCDSESRILVKTSKNTYHVFTDGEISKYPFKAIPGNANNL